MAMHAKNEMVNAVTAAALVRNAYFAPYFSRAHHNPASGGNVAGIVYLQDTMLAACLIR
jgi:hypothetical protein